MELAILSRRWVYRPGTPALTAGLVSAFPSGAKQYCEIGWYGVTLKGLICVTGLGQRFTGQPWGGSTQGFLVTKLPGRSPNGASGVMRAKDSQQGFLQFMCLEAFPTSEYLQLGKEPGGLSHIQMSTALQARGDPNTHHETAAAESCPCETNAMLKTSQQRQVLTRVRSHRDTCCCWQPRAEGRAHWKAVGQPALFCFQCWELNPEPHI